MMEKTYEHIRMDFDGSGKVIIRRDVAEEDKAVVYTDLPTLKEELRDYAGSFPDLVDILVDDPEEENPEADCGMMQAVLHGNDKRGIMLAIFARTGVIQPVLEAREIVYPEGNSEEEA